MTASNSASDDAPVPIAESEQVGRGVFSGRHARAAERGRVPLRVFQERRGHRAISVDRLTQATLAEAVANADAIAAARQNGRRFYGWAALSVGDVLGIGCAVAATPYAGNPYHADILLPESVIDDWAEQQQYALELAVRARWTPRPP